MAGSRLEKLGNIFSRVSGLIRSGAMKRENKPIWYEVYQVFPPVDDPSYENIRPKPDIREIFYPEDTIRAKFHRKMNNRLPTDLSQENTHDVTHRVISLTYEIRQKNAELTEDEAVNEAIAVLRKEGLVPRNRPMRIGKAKSETPLVPESISTRDGADTDAIKTIQDRKIDISNIFEKK